MADKRSVWTILEDSNAEGVRLLARQIGDASGDNHAPVVASVDVSGNYQLIQIRSKGDAVGESLPALGAEDSSNLLQFIQVRAEGEALCSSVPVLPAKDSSGNLAHLQLNSDGELLISNEPLGTGKFGSAIVTPDLLGTAKTIVDVALSTAKDYESIQWRGSCNFPVKWELCQVNDAAVTVLESFLTGSGQFSFSMAYKWMKFTSGGAGTQALRVRATQLTGVLSDCHAYAEAFEKA